MLHCPSCSAPYFDVNNAEESVLDTIPRDSLAVELAAAVTKARQTIDKLEPSGQSKINDRASDIDKALEVLGKAWNDLHKLRKERLAAAAAVNLRAKLPYIHLLSIEILSPIFSFCVEPEDTFFTLQTTIAIGGVCKKWRNVLLPILSRIRNMSVGTTDLGAHHIAMLGQAEFSTLEELSIHLSQGGKQMTTFSTIDTFLNAPNLKHLSLSRCMHTAEVMDDLSSFSFPWQQLTSFRCCFFSTDNLVVVLKAARQLQTLSFTIRPYSEPPKRRLQNVLDFVRSWDVVTHKGITKFQLDGFGFIKHEGGGDTLVDDLLSRVTMPSLTQLCIRRTKDCNLRQLAPFVERSYLQDTLTMVDLSGQGGGDVPFEVLGSLTQLDCLRMDVSSQKVLLDVLSQLSRQGAFPRLRTLLLRYEDKSCDLVALKDALRVFINVRAKHTKSAILHPNYYDIGPVEIYPDGIGPRSRVGKRQRTTTNHAAGDPLHIFELLLPQSKAEDLKGIFEHMDF